jgi:imidazolonepropionase-like amidohydrolase
MNGLLLAVLALVGGTVYPVAGPPIDGATVLIEDGRVTAVGREITIPDDAERIDATGHVITPGFFDAWTTLGLVEISGVDHTNDADDGRSGAIRASHRVTDSYNPASSLIPIQRAHGLTTVGVVPRGGIISGQAAVYDLGAPKAVRAPVGFVARFGARSGGSRSATLAKLRSVIDEVRFYRSKRRQFEQNRTRPLGVNRLDLEALEPLIEGKVPLFLQVNRRSDIVQALEFAREMRVKLVLVGAAEAWLEAKRIAAAGVGVILDPSANAPANFDSIKTRADAASILEDAGVEIAISTFATHNARKLRQWAGNAVRAGLSKSAALRAITRTPAKLYGLPDRGLIAPGMVANLVIWSGDPFEFSSRVRDVFILGSPVDLNHRQRALFKRYRTLSTSSQ